MAATCTVHVGVECGVCGENPILGVRVKLPSVNKRANKNHDFVCEPCLISILNGDTEIAGRHVEHPKGFLNQVTTVSEINGRGIEARLSSPESQVFYWPCLPKAFMQFLQGSYDKTWKAVSCLRGCCVVNMNVQCDACNCPIWVPRFKSRNSKKENLCLRCYVSANGNEVDYERFDEYIYFWPCVESLRCKVTKGHHDEATGIVKCPKGCHAFHLGIACNGCGIDEISGPRFKSMNKVDYNLCLRCYKSKKGNEAEYKRIYVEPSICEDDDEVAYAEAEMLDLEFMRLFLNDVEKSFDPLFDHLVMGLQKLLIKKKYVKALQRANVAAKLLKKQTTVVGIFQIVCAIRASTRAFLRAPVLERFAVSRQLFLECVEIGSHVLSVMEDSFLHPFSSWMHDGLAHAYRAAGMLYMNIGFLHRANKFFKTAEDLTENPVLLATCRMFRASIKNTLLDFANGIFLLQECEYILKQHLLDNPCDEPAIVILSEVYVYLGCAFSSMDELKSADEKTGKAQALLAKIQPQDQVDMKLIFQSEDLIQGKGEYILGRYQSAIQEMRRNDRIDLLARVLYQLGWHHLQSKDSKSIPKAIEAFEECVTILAEIQRALGSNAIVEQITIFEKQKESYTILQEAYGMLAYAKAMDAGIECENETGHVVIGGCCPRGSIACEVCKAVLQSLICTERSRTRVLRSQLQQTQQSVDNLLDVDCDDEDAMIRVITRVCPHQAVIIEYAFGHKRLWIWIVTELGEVYLNSVDFLLSGHSDPILGAYPVIDEKNGYGRSLAVKMINDTLDALSKRDDSHGAELENLYDLLIRPISDIIFNWLELMDEEVGTMIVVPDEELCKVPFQALRDRDTNSYLIENCAIALEPSISVYDLCQRRAEQLAYLQDVGDFLIVSDPKPVGTEKFLSTLREAPGTRKGARWLRQKLNSIPWTQTLNHVTTLIGEEASKARVLQLLRTAGWVQVFCHGIVNDTETDKWCPAGGLVLGNGSPTTGPFTEANLSGRVALQNGGQESWHKEAAQTSKKRKEVVEDTGGMKNKTSGSTEEILTTSQTSDISVFDHDEFVLSQISAYLNDIRSRHPNEKLMASFEYLHLMKSQDLDTNDSIRVQLYLNGIMNTPYSICERQQLFEKMRQIEMIRMAALRSKMWKENMKYDPRIRHVDEEELGGWGSSQFKYHDMQGILPAEQIASLFGRTKESNLRARGVILSACTTGRGTVTGEGLLGFARALILAGVPSVVLSGWMVDDTATFALMQCLYKNLLEKRLPLVHALREAMLTMLDGEYIEEEMDNPLPTVNPNEPVVGKISRKFQVWHWAAFHVIGHPNSIIL